MICEKCGTKYLSRECPNCNKQQNTNNNPIKSKNFKINFELSIKNILLSIIAISVLVIATIMMKNEYVKYRQEQEMMKLLFGTDNPDEVKKRIDKIQKRTNKMINGIVGEIEKICPNPKN